MFEFMKMLWMFLLALLAEGEGGGNEEEESNEEEEEEEEETNEEQDIKDPKAAIKAREEANARLSRKLKRKDKEMGDLAKKIKELEDKDKSEDEKKNEEVESQKKTITDLESKVGSLNLEIMILSHPKLSGLSPRRRKLISREILPDLKIDDDGESNFEELLEDLEKDDPDLVKVSKDDDDDDDDSGGNGQQQQQQQQQSGARVGGKKKKDKNAIDEELLKQRLPALRR